MAFNQHALLPFRKKSLKEYRQDLCADATIARHDLFQLGELDGEFESTAVAVAMVGLKHLFCHGGVSYLTHTHTDFAICPLCKG